MVKEHKEKPVAIWDTLKKWGMIAGVITAIGGSVPTIYWGFNWVAKVNNSQQRQDDNISELKKSTDNLDNKIDSIQKDVSEVKGMVKILVEEKTGKVSVAAENQ